MGIDRVEATGRRQTTPKTSTKHPYCAIEWRVVDSPAYADLTYAARALLVPITRQLTKDNNGRLQSTFTYMRRFGFSENTLSRSIQELIAHGMIYRTRSGGYQQGAAQYAVTWLPIKNREGLFLDGFLPCAWRNWDPGEENLAPSKLRRTHLKNGKWTPSTTPKFEAGSPPKSEDTVLMPCRGVDSALREVRTEPRKNRAPSYASPYLIERQTTADRGQLRVLH